MPDGKNEELSLSDVADAGYWRYAYYQSTVLFFGILFVIVRTFLAPSLLKQAVTGIMALLLIPAVFLTLPSLWGIYKEIKLLEQTETEWKPNVSSYILVTVLLSPAVSIPAYILDRWIKIGLPHSGLLR
jgi:hypothetical protein